LFQETQEIINQKVAQARAANIGIVYCVGETLEEREQEMSEDVIHEQLASIKECLDQTHWQNVIIAYEPIWAQNTGKISSADQTQEGLEIIRTWLKDNCGGDVSTKTRIIYAGPITETNTENIIKLPDVDGFLIGSTSTKPVFRNIFDLVVSHVERDARN